MFLFRCGLVKNILEKVGFIMGYALFAQRKVSLVAQIADLQWQLMDIANQKHAMIQYEAVIADGAITDNELFDNPGIYANLLQAQESFAGIATNNSSYINEAKATKENELAELYPDKFVNGVTSDQDIERQLAEYQAYLEAKVCQEYVQKVHQKELAVKESALDQKQKRIETRLTAMQQELQSVEQAEAQAIQNATPKYAGLG